MWMVIDRIDSGSGSASKTAEYKVYAHQMDARKVMNGTQGLVVLSYLPRNRDRFLGCDDNPPNRAYIQFLSL